MRLAVVPTRHGIQTRNERHEGVEWNVDLASCGLAMWLMEPEAGNALSAVR